MQRERLSPSKAGLGQEEEIQELQVLYRERQRQIRDRLEEFRHVLDGDELDVFAELCFCILTPQSEARSCWDAVITLKEKGLLLKGQPKDLAAYLQHVRFFDNKAKYIAEARNLFSKDGVFRLKQHLQSFVNPYERREWYVENVRGLGYKEASHFLRNIGLGEVFAILDRHILRNMGRLQIIDEVPVALSRKKYLDIEDRFKRFANEIGISPAELDLLFWSRETGWIFK